MVKSNVSTPEAYIAELPPERREAITEVRKTILDNLPDGYQEGMQYGMISYHIPLDSFPDTYNGQPLGVVTLASQKNYMSLYLLGVCYDPQAEQWFKDRFRSSGKKLNMGKSCVRFRSLEDLPLGVIAEAVAHISPEELIGQHEAAHAR